MALIIADSRVYQLPQRCMNGSCQKRPRHVIVEVGFTEQSRQQRQQIRVLCNTCKDMYLSEVKAAQKRYLEEKLDS